MFSVLAIFGNWVNEAAQTIFNFQQGESKSVFQDGAILISLILANGMSL